MKKIALFVAIISLTAGGLFYYHSVRTVAADLSVFRPDRIIDDSVFTKNGSMTANDIQNFFVQHNSVCLANFSSLSLHDDNGDGIVQDSTTEPYGPGTMTAAQLIKAAADIYKINPEVILVTLQKEQGLITTTDCASWKYNTALGYGCPDTSPCDQSAYGFTRQIDYGTYHFRGFFDDSLSSVPYGTGNQTIAYNPDSTCGSSVVNIQNWATAALYSYTPYQPNAASLASGYGTGDACSSYGNRNFFSYFSDWFGSPYYTPPVCDSKVSGVSCVWQLYNGTSDSNFLTISNDERDNAVANYRYNYTKMPFYAFSTQQPGTIPVYRINTSTEHYYTTSDAEKTSLLQNSQNTYDGIAFYVYPASTTSNATYPVHRLSNAKGHVFTFDDSLISSLISRGYADDGVVFNSPSGIVNASNPSQNHLNTYRLNGAKEHFYTTNLNERDALLRGGWTYEGIMMETASAANSQPVYRLISGDYHMFTSSTGERDQLVNNGWKYEGVVWYIDSATPQVYRFNINGAHFFTTDQSEAFRVTNKGTRYEGVAFGYNQAANSSVFRLFDGTYHLFTADIDEAMKITNAGWRFEGASWYGSSTTTSAPVYRLFNGQQHFYTSSDSEKSQLVSNGWKYEGTGWYGSSTTTSAPVYRLFNGQQHFYTSSDSEKSQLVSNGWKYEGTGWYGM